MRLLFYSHVKGHDDLERMLMEGMIPAKRERSLKREDDLMTSPEL